MLRKELEDTVSAKLASLSNENAQRIAEEFVRIRYPGRFPYFAFRAFSPEGKSRPGWPDAALIRPDGRIYGVEATHTADRAGVTEHLLEYISKASKLDPGKLASFIHVSVSPKVAFTPDEIADWTKKFVAAGFTPGTVELLFGQTLVHGLCGPEFVRTRIEILGIPDRPTHFRLYRSKIGPDEGRLGDFIPSWEDFDQGRVHRPAEAESVQARLDADGVALLRGIGASGKTVLAWLLAQDVMKKGLPAYSCDFADYPEMTPDVVNKLAEDLALFAHPEVLFVLDNIHLDETKAKELYQAWEEIVPTQRPRLLLVGRETRTAKGSPIANLQLEAVALRARQAALGGVFRRLALRRHDKATLPIPPEAVLTSWLGTFGGKPERPETTADLIAFSAAVARRMPDLCRGIWTLQKADAVEHMQMVYLDKLSREERQNLSRLCIAERFELGIQNEALADGRAELKTCNTKLGIVFRDQVGARRQFVRYRLVHAALAELLIAAEEPVDEVALMRDMARAHPRLGFMLATRLLQAERQQDAKALVETMMTVSPSFLSAFDNLINTQASLRLIKRLGIDLPVDFGAHLVATQQDRDWLVAIALRTPLHFLASFLGYAKTSLPAVFKALDAALAEEKNLKSLTEIALRASLGHLASFLGYAKTSLPAVFKALNAALAEEENLKALAAIALRTPLGDLASFLGYAKTSLPAVFEALAAALAEEGNRKDLAEIALRTPLGQLASFLGYAKTSLPAVFEALAAALAEEGNRKALAEIALRTPLDHLASFLGYAKTSLPAVFKALNAALAEEGNRKALVEIALRTPLEHFGSFLAYAEAHLSGVCDALAAALTEEENLSALVKIALRTPLGHLASFLGHAETSLPAVFKALAAALAEEKNLKDLAEIALRTPLDHLASFLGYAETSLPAVFEALYAALAEEKNLARLAENMFDTDLGVFVGLLRNSQQQSLWPKAFRRLSLEKWTDSRMRGPLPKIDAFVAFETAVSELGRPEFARAPARKIVLHCTSSDWQRSSSVLGLHHLAAILRAAAPMPEEQVGQFLDRVVDADWLDRCFAETWAGPLAGNLFDLWHVPLNRSLYRRFDRLRLREKIHKELFRFRDPKPSAEALSLWGAASLLGVLCDTSKVVWPDVEALGAVLRLRDPGPERKSLDKLDIQLWLGLRLMAGELEHPIAISEEIGERILSLWQATQPATAGDAHSLRLGEVRAGMIAWLKACGEAGWTLVPPAPSL